MLCIMAFFVLCLVGRLVLDSLEVTGQHTYVTNRANLFIYWLKRKEEINGLHTGSDFHYYFIAETALPSFKKTRKTVLVMLSHHDTMHHETRCI
jgi:hypothetical protein